MTNIGHQHLKPTNDGHKAHSIRKVHQTINTGHHHQQPNNDGHEVHFIRGIHHTTNIGHQHLRLNKDVHKVILHLQQRLKLQSNLLMWSPLLRDHLS